MDAEFGESKPTNKSKAKKKKKKNDAQDDGDGDEESQRQQAELELLMMDEQMYAAHSIAIRPQSQFYAPMPWGSSQFKPSQLLACEAHSAIHPSGVWIVRCLAYCCSRNVPALSRASSPLSKMYRRNPSLAVAASASTLPGQHSPW